MSGHVFEREKRSQDCSDWIGVEDLTLMASRAFVLAKLSAKQAWASARHPDAVEGQGLFGRDDFCDDVLALFDMQLRAHGHQVGAFESPQDLTMWLKNVVDLPRVGVPIAPKFSVSRTRQRRHS
jgi:hypothetical protein